MAFIFEKEESDLLDYAEADLRAAMHTRTQVEELKLRSLKAYSVGGELARTETDVGEFGWSKLNVPMVYWVIETEVPRIALGAPTLIASARSPQAVRYQHAKTMRLQEQMRRSNARQEIFKAVKSMSLFGLGPVHVTWDGDEGHIRVKALSWFDFFLSPDAHSWEEAEVMWVRQWYTPMQIENLKMKRTAAGKLMYKNLDELQEVDPAAEDPTYGDRREYAGEGQQVFSENARGLIPLYTGYYSDGSQVTIGGLERRVVVLNRMSPYLRRIPKRLRDPKVDENGEQIDKGWRPYHPIFCLSNSPNTQTVYPMGTAEVVIGYQEELSTIRRQSMDQVTAHINSPIIVDLNAVGDNAQAKIQAAFGRPGGVLPVNAPGGTSLDAVVKRVPPGNTSFDIVGITEMLRLEAQLATGISDFAAGVNGMNGLGANATATAVQRITDEANMRYRMKNAIIEDNMQVFAQIVENIDHQFGGIMFTETSHHRKDAAGITPLEGGEVSTLSLEACAEECEWEIKVEAGSLVPASQSEELQNLGTALELLSAAPQMASMVNWEEVAKDIAAHAELDPDRVLLTQEQAMMQMAAGMAGEGETPEGPPIPVDEGGSMVASG